MTIDHIDVINLCFEYPAERRFDYAGGTCTGRLSSLILVHTGTGHVGIGSAYSHAGWVTVIEKGRDTTSEQNPRKRLLPVTTFRPKN